jgi:BTB/POZ domain
MVHRNILAARSPVFASLLAQLEGCKEKTTEKLENIQVGQLCNPMGKTKIFIKLSIILAKLK